MLSKSTTITGDPSTSTTEESVPDKFTCWLLSFDIQTADWKLRSGLVDYLFEPHAATPTTSLAWFQLVWSQEKRSVKVKYGRPSSLH